MGETIYKDLVEEIEVTRQKMELAGLEYGLTHGYTVSLSTMLDELLNEFQSTKHCE